LTRRRLLVTGGASGAAALAALNPRLAAAATAVVSDPAYLRRASYAGHLGERFDVNWWGSSGSLTLIGVNDIGTADLAGRDDAFSLVFSGDPSLVVGNGPLALGNRRLGGFELLVTAVGPRDAEPRFEAIVNRSVGANRPKAPQPSKPPASQELPHGHGQAARFVRSARARRTAHGVRFDVVLADGARAKQAHAWLLRRERVVAAFDWTPVREHRIVMRLRRRLRPGSYVLVVGTGRSDGELARVPVRLR
jgi:hypothetical protein